MKKKKKKTAIFEGLCISYSRGNLTLVNVIKKEKIYITFQVNSPFVYKIDEIKKYKKIIFRVSKLYFKSGNSYFNDFANNLISNIASFKIDFFFSAYMKKKIVKKKKKIKKFKKKYTHTENWKNLKSEALYDYDN